MARPFNRAKSTEEIRRIVLAYPDLVDRGDIAGVARLLDGVKMCNSNGILAPEVPEDEIPALTADEVRNMYSGVIFYEDGLPAHETRDHEHRHLVLRRRPQGRKSVLLHRAAGLRGLPPTGDHRRPVRRRLRPRRYRMETPDPSGVRRSRRRPLPSREARGAGHAAVPLSGRSTEPPHHLRFAS